jgi:methylamine dehydrogenase accessory protein MauD
MASIIALWVFTLGIAALLAGALRQLGLIQLRLGPDPGVLITDQGLDRGTQAPDFEATDAESGEPVRFYDLPRRERILAFVSPSCTACQPFLEGLNEMIATHGDELDVVVVCRDQREGCLRFGYRNSLKARLLADPSETSQEAYGITMTPFVFLLDEERRVLMRGVANDWRALEALIHQEGTVQGERVLVGVSSSEEVADDGSRIENG